MLRRAIPFVAAAFAFGLLAHAEDPLRGDAAFTAFFHEIAVTQDFKDASPENALAITSDDWGRVKAAASDCDRQTNFLNSYQTPPPYFYRPVLGKPKSIARK